MVFELSMPDSFIGIAIFIAYEGFKRGAIKRKYLFLLFVFFVFLLYNEIAIYISASVKS